MSDIEHAGWAVGGPGSRLRRHRSPVLGLIAVLLLAGIWLLIGGSAALVLGVPAAMRWRAGTLRPASRG